MSQNESTKLKAYAITWSAYPALAPTFAAETAAKAKYLAYRHARSLRRPSEVSITQFTARRAPEYDAHITRPGAVFVSEAQPFLDDDGTGRRISDRTPRGAP